MDSLTCCTLLSPVSQGPEPLWCLRKAAGTDLTEVINPWQDVNQLKRFISAFPINHSDKRNLST